MTTPKRHREQRPGRKAGSSDLGSMSRFYRWLSRPWTKKRSTAQRTTGPATVPGGSRARIPDGTSGSTHFSQERLANGPVGSSARCSPILYDGELHTTHQSLWDRAYDALREEDKQLVEEYEELLLNESREPSTNFRPDGDDMAHGLNGTSRSAVLSTVINRGLEKMQKDSETSYTIAGHKIVPKSRIADAANLLIWAKNFIDEAIKASPEASIVWAGVCLVLPLLTNPVTAGEANHDGFAYVSTRMSYYTALEPLLQRLGHNPEVPSALKTEADGHLINLYQHILEFQLCSVLRFYHGSARRYCADVLQRKDWKSMKAAIEKLDAAVHQNLMQTNSLAERQELENLNRTSMENHKALERLLQVAEDQRDIAQRQLDMLVSEEQSRCLRQFYLSENSKDSTYEWYKDRIEDRVKGTCQWFLQHDNFQRWLGQKSGPLLVSADPGCGKSVLAKHLIDNVLPQPAVTVCYFFFKDQDQNTVRQALCALLHQLLCQKPLLIKHAMEPSKKAGSGLINSTSLLWAVFENAVKDPEAGSVIVVLDGLDECGDTELENLARTVESQFCGTRPGYENLRYLLTSRPYEQIISSLRGLSRYFPHVRIPGEGGKESDIISQEVNLVVKYRVDRMELSAQLKASLEEKLLEIPHRTYLWVYLVFDHLKTKIPKKTEAGVKSAIATLPQNVNKAYEQILRKSPDPALARKVLCIILAAHRPLTLSEMNTAVNVDEKTAKFDDLDLEEEIEFQKALRRCCGLFVSVHHGKIYFLHQTAREFLLSEATSPPAPEPAPAPLDHCWQRSFTGPGAHKVLAEACIIYLSLFDAEARTKAKRDEKSFPFLDYSAGNWGAHFQEACFGNDAAIVSRLLKICDPDFPSCLTWWEVFRRDRHDLPDKPGSSLIIATLLGHAAIVKLLLTRGTDIEAKDEIYCQTPLTWAAEKGYDAVAGLLLSHGADAEAAHSDSGWTPLLYAVRGGHDAVVKLLLARGVDVGVTDIVGMTPLLWAAREGYDDVVKLLLSYNVDVEASDEGYQRTPLLWAAREDHDDVVRLLLAHGVDVEAKDYGGRTPLSLAAREDHDDVVRLLLAHGVDVEAKDHGGRTPLSWAAGHDDVVRLLLAHGVDVEAKDHGGRTPLSWAAENRQNRKGRRHSDREVFGCVVS